MQGGVCQRRGKDKLQEGRGSSGKKTREGCLMHSYSLDKCKGGVRLRKKGVISSGEGGLLT